MRKGVLLATFLLTILTLTTSYCGHGKEQTEPPVQKLKPATTWKLNSVVPESSIGGKWEKYWIGEVERRSDGWLKIYGFWGGELGYKGPELLEITRDGLVEASALVDVYIGGSLPEMTVISLGFLMSGPLQAKIVRKDIEEVIGKKMCEDWNTVLVGFWPSLGQTIVTRKPIRSVSDLKGLKTRTSTEQQAKTVQILGGFPQTILFGEIYTSMHLGVIDGFITGARNLLDMKLHEIAGYVTFPAVNSTFGGIMVNKDAFDALPENVQKVLFDAGEETTRKVLQDLDLDAVQLTHELQQVGVEITQLPAEELIRLKVKMIPIWDEWKEKASPQGQQLLRTIREKLHRSH